MGPMTRVKLCGITSLADLAGKPLLLAPGGAIVVLATAGAPV